MVSNRRVLVNVLERKNAKIWKLIDCNMYFKMYDKRFLKFNIQEHYTKVSERKCSIVMSFHK